VQTKNIQLAKTTENNRAVDFSTETSEGLKKQAGGCFLALFQRDNKKQPKTTGRLIFQPKQPRG